MPFRAYRVFLSDPASGKSRRRVVYAQKIEYVERLLVTGPTEIVTKVSDCGPIDAVVAEVLGRRRPSLKALTSFYQKVCDYMTISPDVGRVLPKVARFISDVALANAVCRVVEKLATQDAKDAFEEFRGVLPEPHVEALIAGLGAGSIAEVVTRLQTRSARGSQLLGGVTKAVIYPCTVLVIGSIAVTVIVTKELPAMMENFQAFGVKAHGVTAHIFTVGSFLNGHTAIIWAVPVLFIAVLANLSRIMATDWAQRIAFRWPGVRRIMFKVAMANCLATYTLLRRSNIDVLRALEIASRQTHLRVIRAFFLGCRESIGRGAPNFFSAALQHAELLGPDGDEFISMLQVGDEAGLATEIAERVADAYQQSANHALELITIVIEPLMLVLVGSMIGLVVLMTIAPIVDLDNSFIPDLTNIAHPR